ncbi:MAG TPA: SoxR reducing system RseC family protein [Caulifigura sp.]|nr:SoxR reducing system RseC family protein [Caulifigura sp.]
MTPDPLQEAWQTQTSQKITVNTDLLLQAVHDSHAQLHGTILGRDIVEIGTAAVMIPVWLIMGYVMALPWTWYLGVPAFLFVAGFMLVDRKRHPQRPPAPEAPLIESTQHSLTQVEHQVWLLKNVFWWYLLPFCIAIGAFFGQVAWRTGGWGAGLVMSAVVALVYWGIYRLNQHAVRKQLEPHRDELARLLAHLKGESDAEAPADYPVLMRANRCEVSPRRRVIAGLCALLILLVGVPPLLFFARWLDRKVSDRFDSRKSPFAAVRWQGPQPDVKVGDEWFTLVSLDDLPASEIVDFTRRTYGDLWRKRFEEDLVEVLTRMGHPPQDTVRLVVQPIGSNEQRTLEGVRMSAENRRAIWEAAQARRREQQPQPSPP